MKNQLFGFTLLTLFVLLSACSNTDNAYDKSEKLPILGNKEEVDGKTIYHTIPDFQFINQDSTVITNETFKDKIYIVDFFFTSCPTICPKVKQQMLRIYNEFEENDQVQLISHTIDVRNDTIPKLKRYAEKLEVTSQKWHFVTGEKDKLYEMADDYFIVAKEDDQAPGGFDHSGTIILVDKNRHVRAFASGTETAAVDRFMKDIKKLLNE